ncbi:MAG: GatB/YqeY domain-containing protein [Acidobacteriota bacterium]
MTLKQRIEADLKEAMRAKDSLRVSTLRMVRARILEQEVALREQRGRDYQLDDTEVLEVLSTYAKQRRQSIESYRQGGREDLAKREEEELAIVESYLPQPLSEDEIEELVWHAIAETGARGLGDLGRVMKAVMPEVKGRAEGKVVNEIARRCLLSG